MLVKKNYLELNVITFNILLLYDQYINTGWAALNVLWFPPNYRNNNKSDAKFTISTSAVLNDDPYGVRHTSR